MDAKATVLIVDDDVILVDALELYLTREGYRIVRARNGQEGLKAFYSSRPDLVILDVMMPHMDGWETCQRIRELSTVPIIMLTAKGDEGDRVMGLKMGADDYVPKPFSLKELVARIEAILRRVRRGEAAEKLPIVQLGDDLVIDPERWEVRRSGTAVDLTATELRFLFVLAENVGRVLTHQQILERVWGGGYTDNPEYTKLYMWRLRQKLEQDPSKPKYLLTERGIGYRLALGER